jgi:hypothetical protein
LPPANIPSDVIKPRLAHKFYHLKIGGKKIDTSMKSKKRFDEVYQLMSEMRKTD